MTGLAAPGLLFIAGVVRENLSVPAGSVTALLAFMAGLAFSCADILGCHLVRLRQPAEYASHQQHDEPDTICLHVNCPPPFTEFIPSRTTALSGCPHPEGEAPAFLQQKSGQLEITCHRVRQMTGNPAINYSLL
jgi:hypothetical protein